MTHPIHHDARYEILDFVSRLMIGPTDGPSEILVDSPLTRYGMGILFPREMQATEAIEGDEEDALSGDDVDGDGEASDETIRHASKWLPASCGLSFYTDAARIRVLVYGGTYEESKEGDKKIWKRVELASEEAPDESVFFTAEHTQEKGVLRGYGLVKMVSRPLGDGHLVTVTLLNAKEPSAPKDPSDTTAEHTKPDQCLFQVGFKCLPEEGSILEYPSARPGLLEPEEQELSLVYRRHRSFGVGHGCSVAWTASGPSEANEIRSTFMPMYEVPALTTQVGSSSNILRLSYLSDATVETEELVKGLRAFTDEYRRWIHQLPSVHADIKPSLEPARERLMRRLDEACDRIEAGLT